MNEKNSVILRKVYYFVAISSVLMFLGGMLLADIESLSFLINNNFDIIVIGIPFSIWAWLIIVGLLFVKKNWIIITILIALAIPHIIVIMVLYAYSYSILDILRWYVMILSFGSIIP